MIVRYREFVFPPVPNAEPEIVGCVVEWGWNERMEQVELGYRFRMWLGPLADYLYRQMEALHLTLDTLDQGLGELQGRGHWLPVKTRAGASREELRRWFTDTYVGTSSETPVYAPARQMTEAGPAFREEPEPYQTPEAG